MSRNWCDSPRRGCSKVSRRTGSVGVVEHALGAVLLHPVTLDVPKVQGRSLRAARGQTLDVRLDHDPPGVGSVGFGIRATAGAGGAPPSHTAPPDTREQRTAKRARAVARRRSTTPTHARPENRQFFGVGHSGLYVFRYQNRYLPMVWIHGESP